MHHDVYFPRERNSKVAQRYSRWLDFIARPVGKQKARPEKPGRAFGVRPVGRC